MNMENAPETADASQNRAPPATRRRTGWIIAGSIVGLILLVPVLIFVGGFISGLTSGHQRVANGKQVNNAPSANADSPGNLALPDDRCDKALLQGAEKLNATLPRQLDQYSRLDTVLAGHRRMTFFYTIFGLHSGDYTKAQVDEHLDAHQERVGQSYKTMPQLDVYRQNHVEMVYIYKDEDGNYLGQRSIKLDGKQVSNVPSAHADNPGNLALPDDRFDKILVQAANKLNATLPRQVDQHNQLETVVAEHRRMIYFYTALGVHSGDYTKAQIDEVLDANQKQGKRLLETTPQFEVFKQNHVEVVQIYKDEDGNYLGQRSIKLD